MKQFLMGAAVATAVLGAAGFAAFKEPAAAVAVKKTVPLTVGELTLDRAFRFTASVGPSGTISVPTIVPFPASTGVVITSIRGHFGFSGYVSLGVDGFEAERVTVSSENGHTGIIDPPLVVRPGSVLSVGQSWNNGMFPVTLAGYFVYPGEV